MGTAWASYPWEPGYYVDAIETRQSQHHAAHLRQSVARLRGLAILNPPHDQFGKCVTQMVN